MRQTFWKHSFRILTSTQCSEGRSSRHLEHWTMSPPRSAGERAARSAEIGTDERQPHDKHGLWKSIFGLAPHRSVWGMRPYDMGMLRYPERWWHDVPHGGHGETPTWWSTPLHRVPHVRHLWGERQHHFDPGAQELFLDLIFVGVAYRVGEVMKAAFYSCTPPGGDGSGGSTSGRRLAELAARGGGGRHLAEAEYPECVGLALGILHALAPFMCMCPPRPIPNPRPARRACCWLRGPRACAVRAPSARALWRRTRRRDPSLRAPAGTSSGGSRRATARCSSSTARCTRASCDQRDAEPAPSWPRAPGLLSGRLRPRARLAAGACSRSPLLIWQDLLGNLLLILAGLNMQSPQVCSTAATTAMPALLYLPHMAPFACGSSTARTIRCPAFRASSCPSSLASASGCCARATLGRWRQPVARHMDDAPGPKPDIAGSARHESRA